VGTADRGVISLYRGDIDKALQAGAYDAFMHFSAKSLVGESVSHPDRYYLNNVVERSTAECDGPPAYRQVHFLVFRRGIWEPAVHADR